MVYRESNKTLLRSIAVATLFFYNSALMAAVTTAADTIGTTVSGATNFSIAGGTARGANLFHSFNQFNLTSSESATFTYGGTPGTINNIIGRVLGGASSIDGLVGFNKTQLPSTNLFLINPAGIVFGANAQLDITGSFHASTADNIGFGGVLFGTATTATDLAGSALYVNDPVSFGFLDATNAAITVNSSATGLIVPEGETITLASGGLTLDNGDLTAKSGQVNLVSIGSAGTLTGLTTTPNVSSFTTLGAVTMSNGSVVDVSGNSMTGGTGGDVYIRGGSLTMSDSGTAIYADNWSDTTTGGRVDINVTGTASMMAGAAIRQNTRGAASSTGVIINADAFNMSAGGGISNIHTDAYDDGNAGNITITANTMNLSVGDIISQALSQLMTAGDAGDITLTASTSATLNNQYIFANTTGYGNAGTIRLNGGGSWTASGFSQFLAQANTGTGETGNAGNIIISGSSFSADGSSLQSTTGANSAGNAGNITITAADVDIVNGTTVSVSTGAGSSGDSGNIYITANTIDVLNGSRVESKSLGTGTPGIAALLAYTGALATQHLTVDNSVISTSNIDGVVNGDLDSYTWLWTGGVGTIQNGATIESVTSGNGDAGSIYIQNYTPSGAPTGSWTIDGATTKVNSSQTGATGAGSAGTIWIGASPTSPTERYLGTLTIQNSASVSSDTSSTNAASNAGDIFLYADTAITLGTGASVSSSTGMNSPGSAGTITISTEQDTAVPSDVGGDTVTIQGAATISSTSSSGTGTSGNISINTDIFALSGAGSAITNTTKDGLGGNITITAGTSGSINSSAQVVSGTTGAGDAGNVFITTPDIDITTGSTVSTSSTTGSTGDSGNIQIVANMIDVTGSSTVESKSLGSGTPGIVSLLAISGSTATQHLTVDSSVISTSNIDGIVNGDLDSYTWLRTFGVGTIQNGATIESKTTGNGDAGSIYIQNGDWTIDGGSTTVSSSQTGTTGMGSAGTVWIGASPTNPTQRFLGTLDIQNGATVSSNTSSTNAASNAGDIYAYANTAITLDTGASVSSSTGMNSPGSAGTIDISTEKDIPLGSDVGTDTVTIQGGATVATNSVAGTGASGDIAIDTDTFLLDGTSISSNTHDGQGGLVSITADVSGTLINAASISSNTDGDGDAGDVSIYGGNWSLANTAVVSSSQTTNGTYAGGGRIGDAGNIVFDVSRLTLSDSASIVSSTISDATGPMGTSVDGLVSDAGSITITASDGVDNPMVNDFSMTSGVTVTYTTIYIFGFPIQIPVISTTIPTIRSNSENGIGNAGNVTINTGTASINNGQIFANTNSGLGGNIAFNADYFTGTNAVIGADTRGSGNAGNISLGRGAFDGDWTFTGSTVSSNANTSGISGRAGRITADLDTLVLDGGSRFATNTAASTSGNAGLISIDVATSLLLQGGSSIASITGSGSSGNAGAITISTENDTGTDVGTDSVTLQGGSLISSSSSSGTGAAGDISITTDTFFIDGASIISEAKEGLDSGTMMLDPGSITLTATTGTITNSVAAATLISASTIGSGTAGNIGINGGAWNIKGDIVADVDGTELAGSTIVTSSTSSSGSAGTITVDVADITISDYAQVTTGTTSTGNAGNVTIGGDTSVAVDNFAEVSSTSNSTGNAGTVTITTENGAMEGLTGDSITIGGSANITSSATGAGNAGDLNFLTDDIIIDGVSITSETSSGQGGSISFTANNTGIVRKTTATKTLVSASTNGVGNAGSVNFYGNAWTVSGDGVAENSVITSSTGNQGNAGIVNFDVASLTVNNAAIIRTTTEGGATGNAGNIRLLATDSILLDTGASITSSVNTMASGNAGNIRLSTEDDDTVAYTGSDTITIQGGASVTSSSENGVSTGIGSGNPGSITIDTDVFKIVDNSEINATNNAGPNVGPGLGNGVISITAGTGTINTSTTSGDAAEIKSNTVGDGNAGAIKISGGSWTIYGTTGYPYPNYQAQVATSQTNASGLGDAGDIIIDVSHLEIRNSGKVESSTLSTNNTMPGIASDAGNITITADDGIDDSGTNDLLLTGGIPQIYTNSAGPGSAGNITINAGTSQFVVSDVFSQNVDGAGGTITINSDYATIQAATYIKTDTSGAGTAGNIVFNGNILNISGSNQVTSTSSGTGDAGNIETNVDSLTINSSFISTSTGATAANAGTITFNATSDVTLINNTSGISSNSSSGTGDAGSITINAPMLTVNNSVLSTTIKDGSDGSGTITFNADTVDIINNSDVSASTVGTAAAGSIVFSGTDLDINTASQVASSADAGTGNAGIIDIDVTTLNLNTLAQVGTNSSTSGAAGDITVDATTVNVLGGASLSSSSATGTGTGDAGRVTIVTQNFTVDGTGSSVNTVIDAGTDASGAISITANTGTVSNGGEVSASTIGNSDAGSVSLLGGTWSVESSGVVTSSADAGIASTNAGQITIDVASLTVQSLGEVKTDTGVGSAASAGNIIILANDVSVLTGGEISSSSADGTGAAGNVAITTPVLVMNDGEITTETETGAGGTITIAANSATISNFSDITADTEGAGNAGDIILTGDIWTIQSGSVISSDSQAGTGDAGSISLTAGDIIINGSTLSTITANGAGGTITLNATNTNTGIVTNGGQVFADTFGAGTAGDVNLFGVNWIINGGSILSSTSNTGATGDAGTITSSVSNLLVDNAMIVTNSNSPGAAGSITLNSGLITLTSGAEVSSNTTSSGPGGVVTLNSGSDIFLSNGALISTTTTGAPGGNAGNIFINAVDSLYMDMSTMTSSTTGSGDAGSIFIDTGEYVYLLDSTVFADATTPFNVGGGNLSVNTGVLVLDSSTLDVSSNFATGGNVTINADYVFFSPDSVIDVSSTFGTSGSLSVNAVAVDLSGGLNALKIKFQDGGKLLRESCNVQSSSSSSSFIVDNGINGVPAGPGDLQSGSVLNIDDTLILLKNEHIDANMQLSSAAPYLAGSSLFAAAMCGGF